MRWWTTLVLALLGCGDPRTIGEDDPDWSSWDDAPTAERLPVTVATWNVQELGAPGTEDYESALRVIRRLDADVLGLNEIDESERTWLQELAEDAGYSTVVLPPDQPFGSIGNALLSRFDGRRVETPDGAALSEDPGAHDLTRRPVVFTAGIPGTDAELTVVVQHWKSGFEEADVFRRAVDAERTAQAAELGEASDFLIVMGDVNEDLVDLEAEAQVFDALPEDLPGDYSLGDDLWADVQGEGLAYAPFGVLEALGLEPVDALQRDGESATRPTSGRRLDYVFASRAVRDARLETEVYDCRDEAIEGLAVGTPVPGSNDCNHASDHLPVIVRFEVVGG